MPGLVVRPVCDNIVAIHSGYFFGNVTAVRTRTGLLLVDTGSRESAQNTIATLREWDDGPVHTAIFTHGHIDHTWGARLLDAEADARGTKKPHIIAHRNVLNRFDRYDVTQDLNSIVMGRQFNQPSYVFPGEHRRPDEIYDDTLSLDIDGLAIELFHGRGETDDATYVWMPQSRVLVSGDFVIWAFPNAGNPRKVQRYAPDWARTLRHMQTLGAEYLVPGHGPVVMGKHRIDQLLGDTASALECLVDGALRMMNAGATLDEIIREVSVPSALLEKPYLLPKYDDPEFVLRGIWHLYAGWFDGDPARLKPPALASLGKEIAQLSGGSATLAQRADALAEAGETRLAVHLIECASAASPDDKDIQRIRARIYARCIAEETSLIAKALFAVYQRDAEARAG